MLLERATEGRNILVDWAQHSPVLGAVLVMAVCAIGAAVAAALVHRVEPHAEGSGIPRVEAVVAGKIPPGRLRILPVKYVGGVLAIGSGLALGREGPSVQMGGTIAALVARITRRPMYDMRILIAAGAAAGLATAFNAPIAGGVFVLEELVRRFDSRTTVATLLASGSGFFSAQLVIGEPLTLFSVAPLADPSFRHAPMVILLGVVAGGMGALYNFLIVSSLKIADRSRLPRELRAALIGSAVGAVAFFFPELVGGGDNLTQAALMPTEVDIKGSVIVAAAIILVARIFLGVISYAAATPGGLFAPSLVVGSYIGLLLGLLGRMLLPEWTPEPTALALMGIAAFFTASVRAPVTGIVLATELTGVTNQLPPMLGACALAMLVAEVLKSEPIYEALSRRSAEAAEQNIREATMRRILRWKK